MKKVFTTLLLLSTLSMTAMAGGLVKFGVRGGLNVENVDLFKKAEFNNYNMFNDPRTSYHIGAVARISLLVVHVQPELIYNIHRFKFSYENTISTDRGSSTVNCHTIEAPIMVGAKFLFFRVQAGPVFNLLSKSTIKSSNGEKHKIEVNRPTAGFAVGLGADLFKLSFDIRYNGQFSRSKQDISIGDNFNQTMKTNFRNWSFSIGYMF